MLLFSYFGRTFFRNRTLFYQNTYRGGRPDEMRRELNQTRIVGVAELRRVRVRIGVKYDDSS